MTGIARPLAIMAAVAVAATASAQNPPQRRAPRPPDPALQPIADVEGLPRVLLIGDSISIGYTLPVRARLEGKANVHRIPVNAGPTSRALGTMAAWLGDAKWDVIHVNWGLHDLRRMEDGKHQVPLEDYEKNLRELVTQLQATGAKLIWCSTTPVPDGELKPPRSNADVVAYNAVAQRIMNEHGVAINDLYSYALPKSSEIQMPVNVHFTPAGYGVLADEVARVIGDALARR